MSQACATSAIDQPDTIPRRAHLQSGHETGGFNQLVHVIDRDDARAAEEGVKSIV
jgi:hypothetical protein